MKDIFDECEFGDLTLKSRIIRTGLWESQKELGKLSPSIFLRYERLSKNNVGLITTELISMYPHDRFSEYSHYINSQAFIKEFRYVTDTAHENGVPILAQLAFVNCNVNGKQEINVNDLTIEDIRQIQSDYIVAAKKISFAGFDGMQLNLGNNYYLSKVLDPKENRRKDEYGGSAINRARIALELIKVLKDSMNMHINCRINVYPNSQNDALEIAKLLEKVGADSIQVTMPFSPKHFIKGSKNNILFDFTDSLSKTLKIPVILGGGLSDMASINHLINSTDIDFISMQRPFVYNPTFLSEWKNGISSESECRTCNNCYLKKTSTCLSVKRED